MPKGGLVIVGALSFLVFAIPTMSSTHMTIIEILLRTVFLQVPIIPVQSELSEVSEVRVLDSV